MKGFPCSMQWEIQSLFCGGHRKGHCLILNIVAFICCVDVIIKGLAVNGQAVLPVEVNSSPKHIISTKGSSVWLHWNYTYVGDGRHGSLILVYQEEKIGLTHTSQPIIETLARRIGQNGALRLVSTVPAPFNGRVEVISSNSTLVIHGLQYNDSAYHFSSCVELHDIAGAFFKSIMYSLRPIVVSIKVNGIPDFIVRPPSTLDVNEGSNLKLQVTMDGNPSPSADFRWPHLTSSSPINAQSVQLYPFVYSSTYTLNNIDASYCGRILQTILKNNIGSSSDIASTNVTVLCSLSGGFTWNYELIVRRIVLFWKVNGQVLSPVEANSSSSHVITIKGSSLWLHWNYTYIGDGVHGPLAVNYSEQITGFTTTSQPSIETFAKRTGQNGALTLESSVPAPFNRRVEVISANSTFVIHDLQYNDSTYQFSSSVSVDEDAGGGAVNIVVLKPIVSITVNGIPDFIVRPPLPWM